MSKVHSVYMLGIGGIGMSALARFFHGLGADVSGYDKTPSDLTDQLQKEGITVHFDEEPSSFNLDADLLIFTPAIPKTHRAFELTPTSRKWMKRSEVLELITSEHSTIAVAGTHGKTTTSAILAHLMHQANIPISAFIGGILTNYNSNLITSSEPQWVVVEADEYDRSFHRLHPVVGIITSIDPDHLDVYGSHEEVISDFQKFADQCEAVLLHDRLRGVIAHDNVRYYGHSSEANFQISNEHYKEGMGHFNWNGTEFVFQLPGHHNMLNASAALGCLSMIKALDKSTSQSLASFSGVKRRFERVVDDKRLVIIDDYAHHPKEIEAVLESARYLYPNQSIAVVFQPHLYSRTRDLEEGFIEALGKCDEVILLPIYPARELPIQGVSSANLLKKLPLKTKAMVEKSEVVNGVLSLTAEVVLLLGAGDIDRLVVPIAEALKQNRGV